MTTKIAVIGANGQVGSEVCLFLSEMDGIEVVPICRSELAAAPLRSWGLESRFGALSGSEEARRLLAGCQLVADFTLPRGDPGQMRAATVQVQAHAIQDAPAHARYVYISSLMAFGMGERSLRLKWHRLARTQYGRFKRRSERSATKLGRRAGREVYVLRLGEVHGERQGVSLGLMSRVGRGTVHIEDRPSIVVFAFNIAEALVSIAAGHQAPGIYSLVCEPDWSLPEVYSYYCGRAGFEPDIVRLPDPAGNQRPVRAALSSLRVAASSTVARFVLRHRDLLATYLLASVPALERRFRTRYHLRRAASEIAALKEQKVERPFRGAFQGRSPGRRLAGQSDCRTSMEPLAARVRSRLLFRADADA